MYQNKPTYRRARSEKLQKYDLHTMLMKKQNALTVEAAIGIVEILCCFIDPFEDVAYFSYRLAVIPSELRARVISVCRMFTSISNPLGQLLMGFILERYGVPQAVIFGWMIMIITALLFNLQPQVRAARQPV